MISDGVVAGPLPAGESWLPRIRGWFDEMVRGHRLVIVAEQDHHLAAIGQIVYRVPDGQAADEDVCNGTDVAMLETIRAAPHVAHQVVDRIVAELEQYARRRHIKTVTLLVPMESNKAIHAAKGWGYAEFRITPSSGRLIAFFRKTL